MLRWTPSRGLAIDQAHATAVAHLARAIVTAKMTAKVTIARMTAASGAVAASGAAAVSGAAASGVVAVAVVAGDAAAAVDLVAKSGAAVAKADGEARAESGGVGAEVWRGAPATAVGTAKLHCLLLLVLRCHNWRRSSPDDHRQ